MDSSQWANEAIRNGVYDDASGLMDMSFGTGTPNQTGMCGNWTNQGGEPNAPNCIYIIRAEQRYGNGDGVFTLAEQRAASDAPTCLAATADSAPFTGTPRRLRLGFELNF